MSRSVAVTTVLAAFGTGLGVTGAQAAEQDSSGSFDSAQSSLVEVRSSSSTEILDVAGYDGVEVAVGEVASHDTVEPGSQGTTYAVQPSAYGRAAADWIHVQWGWPEAKRKGVPNRLGLAEQYLCHPASQVARVKSYRNLDSWRPTAGLPKTILAGCNP